MKAWFFDHVDFLKAVRDFYPSFTSVYGLGQVDWRHDIEPAMAQDKSGHSHVTGLLTNLAVHARRGAEETGNG